MAFNNIKPEKTHPLLNKNSVLSVLTLLLVAVFFRRIKYIYDRLKLENIIEPWLAKDNIALSEHPIQFTIIGQILEQLENYGEYAEKVGQLDLAKKYEELWTTIKQVDKSKQELKNKVAPKEALNTRLNRVDSAIRRESGQGLHPPL